MSLTKLQQAIQVIQSGNPQAGQKLLVELVTQEPQNEMAWFWLASVVPEANRIQCLENVLRINPLNVDARNALVQLQVAEPEMMIRREAGLYPYAGSHPAQQEISDSSYKTIEQEITGKTEYWVFPCKSEVRVVLFQAGSLILFTAAPQDVSLFLSQVNQTVITKDWFAQNIASRFQMASYQSIDLQQISRVSLFWGNINIHYLNPSGQPTLLSVATSKSDKILYAIMLAFESRVGDGFVRLLKPVNRWLVVIMTFIPVVFSYASLRFLAWRSQIFDHPRYELVLPFDGFLKAITPVGMVIGFIFILICFSVGAILFASQPIETLLVRKESQVG
jgi:hypothetical protein